MKQQLTKRWERIMSLALAACLGIGLLTPGAMAANGSDIVLIEGDPALTEDSDYRANTYIQTSNPSAYANLSTEEALALAALNGDQGFKSFPVTMFNYEGSQTKNNNYTDSTGAFNDAQRQADVETQGTGLDKWRALYFSGGDPTPYSFQYNGFTSEAGYYPAENITYHQLLDSQNKYYVLQNGEYVPVTAESVSKTDYPPLGEQPKVTEGFPNGKSYYMEYQGSYYRITGSEWHEMEFNWGYYEIKGILDEVATLELGPMDAAAQVGVSVADIPVTSVDAGQPAPAEPDVTTGPVETTEPSETTDPAETTEPSETTEPVETTEPTQPAQPPEELPEALSDAGARLAGEVVIARTEENSHWFGQKEHTIQGTVLEKKTLYSVTLRAGETEIFKGDVNSLDEVFNDERLYEHREAGTPVPDGMTRSLPYANYNFWTGADANGGRQYKKYVYNGLMEKELDSEGNPVFTVPDAGIFTEERVDGKTVQKANFPFTYDSATGYYEFNAAEESVYFHNGELHYDDEPQKVNNDGWKTAFLPFNDSYGESANDIQNPDYHFGMRADIEFSMTDDGKWMEQEIQFEFAGDDDMWVFVDGVLVLDLGGIHDSANGVINFATGEVTCSATNPEDFSFGIFGEDITKGNIYTKDGKEGQLGKNFDTFAAENRHTLTIFYLERGAGESNCRIKFNLPQPDSLTVEKEIPATDSEGQRIDQETMDALNEQEFQFVLKDNGQPVSEQLYLKTTVNKKLKVGKTGRDGTFTLRNGEKVKFLTMEYDNNHTYTVEEVTADSRFESVVWLRDIDPVGTVVNGKQSNTFTVAGKEEIAESVTLTATNTYKHVNKTTMQAMPDRVVVDFGLPVVIGVLANDTAANGNKELVNVTVNPEFNAYGTAETTSDGKVKFTLAKPLDQVITLTYTAKAQGATSADVDTDIATVTIIPATQMYYEQDFNGLVSYNRASGIEWKVDETAKDATQEGNVVEGKSPYGADTFYANATGDSAEGVASVDTTTGWASFTYDFTGTGTAILARLESDTGYIYVTVKNKNGDGTADYRLYRDTRVAGSEIGDTTKLYNIPVYQITGLDYGTYTVEVRIAKPLQGEDKYKAGNMFYLDGIRVYDPLNPNELDEVAETAYRDDNERYNKVVSLRDKLINDYAFVTDDGKLQWQSNMDNFVTLTDTNGNLTTAEEYKDIGPKEELYLDEGQSVTFDLVKWNPNAGGKLYLGMKSLTGTGSVLVGNKKITLNNTFDQYYDISKYNKGLSNGRYTFTIRVTNGPVSLTNIKVTGDAEFVITESPEVTFG